MRLKITLIVILVVVLITGIFLFKNRSADIMYNARAIAVKIENRTGVVQAAMNKAEEIKNVFSEKDAPVQIAIDAAKDGPIYGDLEGLKRVEKLESQLHNMKIREDHPRIFINKENIPSIRKKINFSNMHWQEILKKAENGSIIDAAFAYVLLSGGGEKGSAMALNIAKTRLFAMNPDPKKDWSEEKNVAIMALVFDWIYSGLTETERSDMVAKISQLADIEKRADGIRSGARSVCETFHREEWVPHSWRAWPEIALAHHAPGAEYCYNARWGYDWSYGDAARMYAYVADGTPFEGYYYGADGVDWFSALKSSTGINLVDDPEIGWCRNAAYYMLYRMDFGLGREIFHKGVSLGNAGVLSYSKGISAWKYKEFLGITMALASDDPYCKWIIDNISGLSSWAITTTGYAGLAEFKDIVYMIFDSPTVAGLNPQSASYDSLPYGRIFPSGREAHMRTSWRPESTCVGFTSRPVYTMTSHSDFDVNTFMIYKMGNLAPDSGVYDAYQGQSSYFNYQKNTVAHNNILVVDPSRPDEPRKLANSVDPGGTERVSTRTFGTVTKFGITDTFLHNPNANWTQILDFKTTPQYDYVIADAAKAYSTRLNEYIRSLVFIRKGDDAYIVVFDRIESKKESFIKKWLLHLVGEPRIKGEISSTKSTGHYEIYNSDYLFSDNIFNTARLYLKSLLPINRTISKIGGDGYEFYVEGSSPKNWPINDASKKAVTDNLGSPWEEVGTWRIEIIPEEKQKRDYFLNVMFAGDSNSKLDPDKISVSEEDDHYTANIKDDLLGDVKVSFAKTGKPDVQVVIPGKSAKQ